MSSEFRNILVRAPNWIGDQVLAFPFFYYLRKAYPRARIVSACVPWVESLQFRDLVDETFILKKPLRDRLIDKIQCLNEAGNCLREKGSWDLAISLPNSLSAAWLLFRAQAQLRRGYRVDGRGLLLNDGVRWNPDPERHRAQAYVDLLPQEARKLVDRPVKEFWGILPEHETDPGTPGVLACFDSSKSWPQVDALTPPNEPFWVLAPGATADSRRWPLEYWIVLARTIADEKGWKGLVVGGPTEAPLAERLCADPALGLEDWTARGPVCVLSKLFRSSQLTVTNESGLAHVAALCGSFVQIVCGAADPRRTRPIGPGPVRVAINPVDCWPCERNSCSEPPENKIRCLKGIRPEAVWEEIKRAVR